MRISRENRRLRGGEEPEKEKECRRKKVVDGRIVERIGRAP